MLSKELKELETHLLITRTVVDTRPVTITYAITPHGKSTEPLIAEVYKWGVKHREVIIESIKQQ